MAKTAQKAKAAPLGNGNMNNIEPFYKLEDIATALGLADTTIRKYFREGSLKGYKRAGRIYFLHSDVLRFIKGE